MKANIQSVHFTADQKLIDFINTKLEKLQKFTDDIVNMDVTLKMENSGKVKDKIAEIIISIPGNRIVASSTNKTFEQSVDESIEALLRQIKKVKGKRQNMNKGVR